MRRYIGEIALGLALCFAFWSWVYWELFDLEQRIIQLEIGCAVPAMTVNDPAFTVTTQDVQVDGRQLSLPLPTNVLPADTRLLCRFVDARFGDMSTVQVEIWPSPRQPQPGRVTFPVRQVFVEAGACIYYGYGPGTHYGQFHVAAYTGD